MTGNSGNYKTELTMKKTLITVILLTFCAVVRLDAQFVKFSIGVEGSGTVSSFLIKSEQIQTSLPVGLGGYGGAFLEVRFGNILGLDLGTDYSYLTSGYMIGELPVTVSQEYIQIPVMLQLWMGRSVAFEAGIRQSVLLKAVYSEGKDGYRNESDGGAAKYFLSAAAGFKFNLGKVVFLSLGGTYGLSQAYNFYGEGKPLVTGHIGVGFRIYSYQKSAFK